jgi:hypothetical protein
MSNRGGRRSGSVGKKYSNRSDMNDGRVVLPPSAVTGQTYGAAKQQLDAQRQTPMASAPAPSAPAPSAGPVPGAAPMPGPPPVMPGEVTPINAPSLRPDEHPMTGASVGPGGGPEVLGSFAPAQFQPSPLVRGVGLLNSLGENVPDQVKQLRSALLAANANSATP